MHDILMAQRTPLRQRETRSEWSPSLRATLKAARNGVHDTWGEREGGREGERGREGGRVRERERGG